MHDYVYPLILNGKVKDIKSLLKIEAWQLFDRYAHSVKICDVIILNCKDEPLEAIKVLNLTGIILDELMRVTILYHFQRSLEHFLFFLVVWRREKKRALLFRWQPSFL